MIPKRMAFFWGNDTLPWLRYMSVYSFWKLNPDWDIHVFVEKSKVTTVSAGEDGNLNLHRREFKHTGKCYMEELRELPVQVHAYQPQLLSGNIVAEWDNMMPVHKSDLFRWDYLASDGGYYSDMDILYVKPMEPLHQVCTDFDIDTMMAISGEPAGYLQRRYPNLITIGFLGACPNNKFFETILSYASYDKQRYACVGNELVQKIVPYRGVHHYNRLFPNHNLYDMSMEHVYYFSYEQTDAIFKEKVTTLPNTAVGIHWFAGANDVQDYVERMDGDNLSEFDNTISHYAKQIWT